MKVQVKRQPKEKKTILIVEDEASVAEAIREGLARSSAYDFEVKVARTPRELLGNEFHEKRFDIYLVDLKLSSGSSFTGLRIVLNRSLQSPGSLTIVYSAYPQVVNVVKAIQFGAADFVSKIECPPHELVARIEKLLDDLQCSLQRREELDALIEQRSEEWKKEHTGKVIAVVDKKVRASGATRLEALINYEELLEQHPDWPEEPDFLEILK